MRAVYDFFTLYGDAFEVIFSVFCFTWWMRRRNFFVFRALGTGAVMILLSAVIQNITDIYAIQKSLLNIVLFGVSILGLKFCCQVSWDKTVFYSTASGAARHLSYKLASTIVMPIWATGRAEGVLLAILDWGYPLLFVGFCMIAGLTFGGVLRREYDDDKYPASLPVFFFLLIGMQLSTNIFHNLFTNFQTSLEAYTVFNLFDIVCCLFLLAFQCVVTKQEKEHRSREIMEQLLYQQKQQMEVSKETIELINIKCHDIKNQISLLENRVPREEIQELEHAVDIYNTALKTGNETLDILMMEKAMQCEQKGIRLDCMIDGAELSFMKRSDLYSLFGNAVDNAIEAVEKLEDPEKKYICVRVKKERGMLVIHFENYCEGELEFADGLPVTTKKDKRYHGFGMKSIRMIVEKYGGYLSVSTQSGMFRVNILLDMKQAHAPAGRAD